MIVGGLIRPNSAIAIPQPDKFSGDITECKGFLLQGSLYFTTLIGFSEQQKRVLYVNLLTGHALKWATADWNHRGGIAEVNPQRLMIAS